MAKQPTQGRRPPILPRRRAGGGARALTLFHRSCARVRSPGGPWCPGNGSCVRCVDERDGEASRPLAEPERSVLESSHPEAEKARAVRGARREDGAATPACVPLPRAPAPGAGRAATPGKARAKSQRCVTGGGTGRDQDNPRAGRRLLPARDGPPPRPGNAERVRGFRAGVAPPPAALGLLPRPGEAAPRRRTREQTALASSARDSRAPQK